MDFRRLPFQFTSTDPAKRQAELQKRFGLPSKDKMYIDLGNSGLLGSGKCESNSASGSPRLQHRVPIFTEGSSEVMDPVDAHPNNVDTGRKPRVRVVPIEIEGADAKRHRNTSGPAGYVNGKSHLNGSFLPEENEPCKRQVIETTPEVPSKPQIRTIPIKIESTSQPVKLKPKIPASKDVSPPKVKEPMQKNGCNVKSKQKNGCNVSSTKDVKKQVPAEPDINVSLQKIEAVLERLKGYQADVEKFSGTSKEKQYRYLDEMLTRCMLDLDNVDTMGNENVRLSRKAAIKKVQHCIDLLESKLTTNDSSEGSVTISVSSDGGETLAQNGTNSDEKIEDVEMAPIEAPSTDGKETVDKPEQNKAANVELESETVLETKVMEESAKGPDVQDSEMVVEETESDSQQVITESMELDQDTENVPLSETIVSEVTESFDLRNKLTENFKNEKDIPQTSTNDEPAYIVEEPESSDTDKETSDICDIPNEKEMTECKTNSKLELDTQKSISEENTCITEIPSTSEVNVNATEAIDHSIETVDSTEIVINEQCSNLSVENTLPTSNIQSSEKVKS